MSDVKQETTEAARLAGKAAELGKEDAVALSFSGLAPGYVVGEVEAGVFLIDRALVLNPNLAIAWNTSGLLKVLRGDLDIAIEHLARAVRLSPLDPMMFFIQAVTAFAHFFAGRYDEACPLADRACREQPNFLGALRIAAANYVCAGRLEEARGFIARALELDPELRLSNLRSRTRALSPERFAKYVDALRKAGLPE
jgi:tetratricopeptide (TPR) repeat protein